MTSSQPSKKYIYLIVPFLKGFALFLILSGLFGIVGCGSHAQAISGWKPATKVVSEDTAKQIIADNSSEKANENTYTQLEAIRLTNKLTLFKINSPSFCGYFGCLHLAYLEETPGEYRPILRRYINPLLPKNTTQIQLLKEPPNGVVAKSSLPCLRFFQAHPTNNILQQITECFDGQVYKIVETRNSVIGN
ncbi:hypothetical protein [Okeania sp. SIO2B3]|uniref:hypothetical protein n=1 Tax=Okeania sp. SIO2B3 TaxID=2607784 RepID=UPI0013C1112E|nr:hypothetical protein [Okeania sp. SIO2B3]NET46878.1 hypothetical protein [Okeania sp. SIO2B3]